VSIEIGKHRRYLAAAVVKEILAELGACSCRSGTWVFSLLVEADVC
jgi:hypothetical protein